MNCSCKVVEVAVGGKVCDYSEERVPMAKALVTISKLTAPADHTPLTLTGLSAILFQRNAVHIYALIAGMLHKAESETLNSGFPCRLGYGSSAAQKGCVSGDQVLLWADSRPLFLKEYSELLFAPPEAVSAHLSARLAGCLNAFSPVGILRPAQVADSADPIRENHGDQMEAKSLGWLNPLPVWCQHRLVPHKQH